jgi:hypothetical protein
MTKEIPMTKFQNPSRAFAQLGYLSFVILSSLGFRHSSFSGTLDRRQMAAGTPPDSTEKPRSEFSPLQCLQLAHDFLRVGAAVEGADMETAFAFEPKIQSRLPRQCLLAFQQRGMRIIKSAVKGMRREIA